MIPISMPRFLSTIALGFRFLSFKNSVEAIPETSELYHHNIESGT